MRLYQGIRERNHRSLTHLNSTRRGEHGNRFARIDLLANFLIEGFGGDRNVDIFTRGTLMPDTATAEKIRFGDAQFFELAGKRGRDSLCRAVLGMETLRHLLCPLDFVSPVRLLPCLGEAVAGEGSLLTCQLCDEIDSSIHDLLSNIYVSVITHTSVSYYFTYTYIGTII